MTPLLRTLLKISLGMFCLLWLLVLAVLTATIGLFYMGLVVPGVDVFFICESWGYAILLVLLTALGWAVVKRRLGWLLGREALRVFTVSTVILVSLLVLFYSIELWRGKRAWAGLCRELAASGEKPGLTAIIPPPVPDAQNLAKAPIFTPLDNYNCVDWTKKDVIYQDPEAARRITGIRIPQKNIILFYRAPAKALWLQQKFTDLKAVETDLRDDTNFEAQITAAEPAENVLRCLERFRPELDEVREATKRPYSRFRVDYARGYFAFSPQLPILNDLAKVFDLRATAALAAGRPDAALPDIQCSLRLAGHASQFSGAFTYPQCTAMITEALQPVWEGLARQRWSDAQLAELQQELARIDLLPACQASLRANYYLYADLVNQLVPATAPAPGLGSLGEQSDNSERLMLKLFRLAYPAGWSYQNQTGLYRECGELLRTIDAASRRFDGTLEHPLHGTFSLDPVYLYLLRPRARLISGDASQCFAFSQTMADLAQTACALERHRRTAGNYPDRLEALIPAHLKLLPADLLTGKPLHYRTDPDGRFTLYTDGMNGIDDGGQIVPRSDGVAVDLDKGDWVWSYQSSLSSIKKNISLSKDR